MIFQQFRHEQGGCLSYIVGCSREQACAVIDPQIETEPYLAYASSHGLRIAHIFETHAQADHLSGARALSEATGAPVHYHESARAGYPIEGVRDGQEIALGRVLLKVLHTPGHTSDSICLLVTDTARGTDPWLVLSGDTLFVGDVGRPDLDGDARRLYASIREKLLPLDDAVELYPTHFAGSSCGKGMSPKPSSTIGFERRFNPALRFASEREFVAYVMSDLPVQPPRFQKVRRFNLGFLREPPIERTFDIGDIQITPEQLQRRIDAGDQPMLLDVREPMEVRIASIGGTHIPMGQIPSRLDELDRNAEIIVYCHHGNRSQRVVDFLYESGFSRVKNLVGGIDAWSERVDGNVRRY